MTDDGVSLLRAVLAHPDEDTPRVMLADWLQAQDCPYAQWYGQFIASQIAGVPWNGYLHLETLVGPAAVHFPRYGVGIHHAPNQLSHCVYYLSKAAGGASNLNAKFHVNRGFIVEAEVLCGEFLSGAGPLFARHPVRSVVVGNKLAMGYRHGEYYDEHVWYKSHGSEHDRDPFKLPPALFDLLVGYDSSRNDTLGPGLGTDVVKIYNTAPEAKAALDAAALEYGRQQARRHYPARFDVSPVDNAVSH